MCVCVCIDTLSDQMKVIENKEKPPIYLTRHVALEDYTGELIVIKVLTTSDILTCKTKLSAPIASAVLFDMDILHRCVSSSDEFERTVLTAFTKPLR